MFRRFVAAAALAGSLGLPALPARADVLVVRRIPASGALTAGLPPRALLAGVTWDRGTATVTTRIRTLAGWQPWQELEAESGGPGVRPGTEPLWLPAGAAAIEVRVAGDVPGARLDVVTDAPGARATGETVTKPRLGEVVTRAGWGADESLRRGKPRYAARVDAVVVHHTASSTAYTEAGAAAQIRAVYAYHTRSRRYDDIAYNLLVDRFGRVYEGRAGGLDRAVVGAHTSGFSTGTYGVSLLGNFDTTEAPAGMLDRVAGAAAWLGDRWGFDPRGTATLTSSGSARYRKGRRVSVPRLVPHSTLVATACPGRHVRPHLPSLAEDAWRRMAAVFSGVTVAGAPVRAPDPVRITARLDHTATWQARVYGPLYAGAFAATVATATATGTAVEVSWNGRSGPLPALPGTYAYELTADDGVHGPSEPVTGTFEVSPPR